MILKEGDIIECYEKKLKLKDRENSIMAGNGNRLARKLIELQRSNYHVINFELKIQK